MLYEAKIFDSAGNFIDHLFADTLPKLARMIKAAKCLGDTVMVPTQYSNQIITLLAE